MRNVAIARTRTCSPFVGVARLGVRPRRATLGSPQGHRRRS